MDILAGLSLCISVVEFIRNSCKWMDDLRPAVDKAYHRALREWAKNNIVRENFADQKLQILDKLPEYIANGVAPTDELKSLFQCFEKELKKDEKTMLMISEILQRDIQQTAKVIESAVNEGFEKSSAEHKDILEEVRAMRATVINPIASKVYFAPADGYIPRTVKEDDLSDWDMYFTKARMTHSLSWYITKGSKYIALYSDAQIGKSTELNALAFELFTSSLYNPFVFEFSKITNNKSLEDQIQIERRFVGDKIDVLILDGLDEVPDSNRVNVISEIRSIADNYPDLYIIVSYRSNYMATNKIDGFVKLHLNELDWDDAQRYIKANCERGDELIKAIENNQYYEFTHNPFLLKECVKVFNSRGVLPRNKAEIYDYFIDKCLEKENNRGVNRGNQITVKTKLYPIISKIAFCLQLSQRKSATTDELYSELSISPDDLDKCVACPLFKCDKERNVEFTHNSFKEYIVAKYLRQQSFDRFKELVCYKNSDKIMPSMHNTTVLMLGIIDDIVQVKSVMDWLTAIRENKELLIRCGTEMLSEQQRNHIFKEIFNDYKRKGLWIEYYICDDLIRFANTRESLLFVIDEIRNATEYDVNTINAFKMLEYANFATLFAYERSDAEVLILGALTRYKDCKHAEYICEVFKNTSFILVDLVPRIFDIIKDSTRYVNLYGFLGLIVKKNQCDNYIDWVLEKAEYIDSYHEDGCSHSVTKDDLFRVYENLHNPYNITKVIERINKDYCDEYRHNNIFGNESDEERTLKKLFRRLLDAQTDEYFIQTVIENIKNIKYQHCTSIYARGYNEFLNKVTNSQALFEEHYKIVVQKLLEVSSETDSEKRSEIFRQFDRSLNIVIVLLTDERLEYMLNDNSSDEQNRYQLSGWFRQYPCVEQDFTDKIIQKFAHLQKVNDLQQREQAEFDLLFDRQKFERQVIDIVAAHNGQAVKYIDLRKIANQNDLILGFIWGNVDKKTKLINSTDIKDKLSDADYMKCFVVNRVGGYAKKSVVITVEQKAEITQIAQYLLDNLSRFSGVDMLINVIIECDIHLGEDTLLGLLPYSFIRVNYKEYKIHTNLSNTYLDYLANQISDKNLIDYGILSCLESDTEYYDGLWLVFTEYIAQYKREQLYPYFEKILSKREKDKFRIIETILDLGRMGIEITKPLIGQLEDKEILLYYKKLILLDKNSILTLDEKIAMRKKLEEMYPNLHKNSRESLLYLLIHLASDQGLTWCLSHAKSTDSWAQNDSFPSLCNYSNKYFYQIKEYFYFALTVEAPQITMYPILQSVIDVMRKFALESEKMRDDVVSILRTTANDNKKFAYFHRIADELSDKYLEIHHGQVTLKQAFEKYNFKVN